MSDDGTSSHSPPVDVPLVFVSDLEHPQLDPADHHHLARALRVADDSRITVSDGAGRWRVARFGDRPAPDGEIVAVDSAGPPITIAFAVVKGDRPELITQKLTELGVDTIVPFAASRSVTRWKGERAERHHERLQKVAREAAMQSRRCRLPAVLPVSTFDEVISLPGASAADPAGDPPTLEHPTILVGPEGGWHPDERSRFTRTVGLGDHVLRAETAAIAAAALLTALRSGRVGPASRSE